MCIFIVYPKDIGNIRGYCDEKHIMHLNNPSLAEILYCGIKEYLLSNMNCLQIAPIFLKLINYPGFWIPLSEMMSTLSQESSRTIKSPFCS